MNLFLVSGIEGLVTLRGGFLLKTLDLDKLTISILSGGTVPISIFMVLVDAPINAPLLLTDVPSAMEIMVHHNADEVQLPQEQHQPPRIIPPPSRPRPLTCRQNQFLHLRVSDLRPTTPINPERLRSVLGDTKSASTLYTGFKFGFRIPHSPSPWKHLLRNHKSVLQNPAFMDSYITKELSVGRILGPFSSLPSGAIISPLGLVPKREPGSYRVIHDLSFPKGRGVNDLIPNHLTSVVYEDFDYVVSLIR